jgi:hypothetical protein
LKNTIPITGTHQSLQQNNILPSVNELSLV